MTKIAVVLADDYEDSEYSVPRERLRAAGHELVVVGTEAGKELGGKRGEDSAVVDATPSDVSADDFGALLVPGGYSPDKLRLHAGIVAFVRAFFDAGKPVAAICHGPQLLIEAEVVEGRRMTSWPSVQKDLENAGARWEDAETLVDGNLVTARKPDDLDAFCDAFVESLEKATADV
jgi:protease I